MSTIKLLGKRKLFMLGISGAMTSTLTLAIYGFINAPTDLTSFDVISGIAEPMEENYIGIIFYTTRVFFSSIVLTIPPTLCGECFPLK